jgi:hypothetical protein
MELSKKGLRAGQARFPDLETTQLEIVTWELKLTPFLLCNPLIDIPLEHVKRHCARTQHDIVKLTQVKPST